MEESRVILAELVTTWEQRARRAFVDAEQEPDAMGKRLLEHGAMCYFNCAQELKAAQALFSLEPSAIPLRGQG